jgi:F-type H+-transporting ATPase subunit gamma
MEMVAASKMRRAQEATKASTPYTLAARRILTVLSRHTQASKHPLFQVRPLTSRLVILIASDKGLAGSYNTNLFKAYMTLLKNDIAQSIATQTITIGRKASQFVSKIKDVSVAGVYDNLPDRPNGSELRSILETARNSFVSAAVDQVDILYTEFENSVSQKVRQDRILPAIFENVDVPETFEAVYEPSTTEVFDAVTYRMIEAQIFQALLDARASEHSMRRVAMKNATDNASDLIEDLTLEMNKARQASITQELAEISGGVEALKDS